MSDRQIDPIIISETLATSCHFKPLLQEIKQKDDNAEKHDNYVIFLQIE